MATGGEFDIKFTADSSDLRAELEKVSSSLDNVADSTSGATNDMRKGLDGAKKSAEGLAKKVPSVGNAAKPATEALKKTGQSAKDASARLSNMEGAAGETSSSMSGLAGALSLISPEAGAAAQAIADTAGGLEAAARGGTRVFAILGPIAVAVAAAGAAYAHFKGQLDDANAALETQRAKLEIVQDMHRKVKEAVLLAALANEEITQTEFDAQSAAQSAADLTRARSDALTEERNALKQKRIALENVTAAANDMADSEWIDVDDADELQNQSAALANVNRQLALNKTQTDTLTAIEKKYAKALIDSKKGIETKSSAATKAAEQEQDQSAERLAALEALGQITEEQNAKKLEGVALLRDNAAAEIEAIQEVNAEYVSDWEVKTAVMTAHHAVRDRLTRDIRALEAKAEKERDRESRKYYAAEKQRKRELVRVTMSANTDLMGSTADLFMAMSTATSEHDKQTARTLFNIWKGLSLAHIGLKTAEGMMTAAALPPPADIIKGAAVAASAGASTLLVATQKPPFHSGSSFVRAPDRTSEMNARLRAGEAVSTPLGAEILGRDNIAAANAGMGTGGGSAPIVFQYEHRAFTRFIRDNVRGVSGGLSDEINAGRTIGQRGVGR